MRTFWLESSNKKGQERIEKCVAVSLKQFEEYRTGGGRGKIFSLITEAKNSEKVEGGMASISNKHLIQQMQINTSHLLGGELGWIIQAWRMNYTAANLGHRPSYIVRKRDSDRHRLVRMNSMRRQTTRSQTNMLLQTMHDLNAHDR